MSAPAQAERSIRSYLERHGWTVQSRGPSGSLWVSQEQSGPSLIAVPDGRIGVGSREWRSVVERLAVFEDRTEEVVAASIRNQFVDITQLRAANDYLIHGSIPLMSGAVLVTSAREMVRASATTAQRQRAQIDGNYSKIGDDLASRARLGHTIEGSFIIPLLMPLPESDGDDPDRPPLDGMETQRVAPESAERRVTRTLAEALTAVSQVIVEPARMPKAADVGDIVNAGVSREFVTALHKIVAESSVAEFEASFEWAPAALRPRAVPPTVSIPHASSDLLRFAAQMLRSSRRERPQSITGPIIEVRQLPDDPFGEVAIQVIRGGRPTEIRVRLRDEQIRRSYSWMADRRTVIVDGEVTRQRGRPLRIDTPTRYDTLDSTFLAEQS